MTAPSASQGAWTWRGYTTLLGWHTCQAWDSVWSVTHEGCDLCQPWGSLSLPIPHPCTSLSPPGSKTPFHSFLGIAQQHGTHNGVSGRPRGP